MPGFSNEPVKQAPKQGPGEQLRDIGWVMRDLPRKSTEEIKALADAREKDQKANQTGKSRRRRSTKKRSTRRRR